MAKKFIPHLYLFAKHYNNHVSQLFDQSCIRVIDLNSHIDSMNEQDRAVVDFALDYYISFNYVVIVDDYDKTSIPIDQLKKLGYVGLKISSKKNFKKLNEMKMLFDQLGQLESDADTYMKMLERVLVDSEVVISREVFERLNDANTDACNAQDFYNETIEDGLREAFKKTFLLD